MKDFCMSSGPGKQGHGLANLHLCLALHSDCLHVISAQPLVSKQLLFAPPQAEMRQQLMK